MASGVGVRLRFRRARGEGCVTRLPGRVRERLTRDVVDHFSPYMGRGPGAADTGPRWPLLAVYAAAQLLGSEVERFRTFPLLAQLLGTEMKRRRVWTHASGRQGASSARLGSVRGQHLPGRRSGYLVCRRAGPR
jgi:hypothetical protein